MSTVDGFDIRRKRKAIQRQEGQRVLTGGNTPQQVGTSHFPSWAFLRKAVACLRNQRGFGLTETLAATGILGIVSVAFFAGLSGLYQAQDMNREQVIAQNLARAQLETIRDQPYLDVYAASVPVPNGYSISVDTQPFCAPEPCTPDDNVQQTSVTVFRDGKSVATIRDMKARR